jgi:hypothetical protein
LNKNKNLLGREGGQTNQALQMHPNLRHSAQHWIMPPEVPQTLSAASDNTRSVSLCAHWDRRILLLLGITVSTKITDAWIP